MDGFCLLLFVKYFLLWCFVFGGDETERNSCEKKQMLLEMDELGSEVVSFAGYSPLLYFKTTATCYAFLYLV